MGPVLAPKQPEAQQTFKSEPDPRAKLGVEIGTKSSSETFCVVVHVVLVFFSQAHFFIDLK